MAVEDVPSYTELEREVARLRRELAAAREREAAAERALDEAQRREAEALARQTATAEVLRVIATSPTDLQTVLDAVAERAARLCEADNAQIYRPDGGTLRLVASHGRIGRIADGSAITRDVVNGRAILDRRTVHVPDLKAALDEFPRARALQERHGHRSIVVAPLLREGEPLGSISVVRMEVRPFTEQQVRLLETFADQAVIAIENTRLFSELDARTRELARSVEELRALGEVGRAVSSTLDLGQVLDTVVANADTLSGTDGGVLYEYDEQAGEFRLRATRQIDDAMIETLRAAPIRLGEGAIGRAARAREPLQIPDIGEGGAYRGRLLETLLGDGYRALLAVPLLREDRILGGLVVARKAPGEFPPNVVDLVRTFAAQSALAIQNACLFREVEDKSLQLEVASRHKSEFLANMSHELRTPLNAIIGFSEVLSEQLFGELNDKQLEYLNDILDLSKVEAGRMELELSEFSLREALENGLTMLKERAARHGIRLTLAMDRGLDVIEADERKVKQVLFNLLSNAVKFTPDGGSVEVSADQADGQVVIAVRDTGIGIAPDDVPRVFDEFRQVGQGTGKAEGTGLGLALARKFVELHGGSISVESEVGAGSTFTFTLPRPAAQTVEAPR